MTYHRKSPRRFTRAPNSQANPSTRPTPSGPGGFGIAKDPAGTVQFTDPKGKIVPPTADKNLRGDFRTIVRHNVEAGLNIDKNTSTPLWYGEKTDYNAPIQSMLYREQGRKPPI